MEKYVFLQVLRDGADIGMLDHHSIYRLRP
jgi:hypothetical protein